MIECVAVWGGFMTERRALREARPIACQPSAGDLLPYMQSTMPDPRKECVKFDRERERDQRSLYGLPRYMPTRSIPLIRMTSTLMLSPPSFSQPRETHHRAAS